MNGYAGKILKVNLTSRNISTIPTRMYQHWIGGHGMGSAIFFDLVKDKKIDGFDPANVITLMTSPLSGTLAPGAAGRTEMQGIGVQSLPIGWFTRSNFGGRFSTLMKSAGWDGIVIEGKADQPVWLDVRNEQAQIRNCDSLSLWGTDTWECQQRIWKYVAGDKAYGDWMKSAGDENGQTTQRPAVLAIGPAGENLSRIACLIHDASNGSGQGGFGAVWGSKRLKAVSVIGTGSTRINDPRALMKARLWQQDNYAYNPDDKSYSAMWSGFDSPPDAGGVFYQKGKPLTGKRPQACVGCHSGCRARYEDGLSNESTCFNTFVYGGARSLDIQRQTSDLLNRFGLNATEMFWGEIYLRELNLYGALGPGKQIDCPLNFKRYGRLDYIEQLIKAIAYRNDGMGNPHPFGNDLAEGFVRAAEKWGLLKGPEGDLKTGRLRFPFWGLPVHFEPAAQLDWSYGTILGDRDINEHDFNALKTISLQAIPAQEVVKIYTDKMVPFQGDTRMLDFSSQNMYSEHIAKMVSWHRYYTRFWKQSVLYCDWRWPDFVNFRRHDKVGSTGHAEPAFLNAVTGKSLTFLDGIELGRKIWNLDHAIWTLQGRHRDMVRFADYIYDTPSPNAGVQDIYMPGLENGKWRYLNTSPRKIDRDKFEEFKTRFYKLQGWEISTGYPMESTLKSQGLDFVADELKENGKLGKG